MSATSHCQQLFWQVIFDAGCSSVIWRRVGQFLFQRYLEEGRPILTQLDFCSPLKQYLSVRSNEKLSPRKCWKLIGFPRVRMCRNFFQDLSRALLLIAVSFFSIRSEMLTVFDPVGSKTQCWRWLPATGSLLEKRETAQDIIESWRKLPTHSEARKTNFQLFRGKSSFERTERYFFNGLQIQVHNNWP